MREREREIGQLIGKGDFGGTKTIAAVEYVWNGCMDRQGQGGGVVELE